MILSYDVIFLSLPTPTSSLSFPTPKKKLYHRQILSGTAYFFERVLKLSYVKGYIYTGILIHGVGSITGERELIPIPNFIIFVSPIRHQAVNSQANLLVEPHRF